MVIHSNFKFIRNNCTSFRLKSELLLISPVIINCKWCSRRFSQNNWAARLNSFKIKSIIVSVRYGWPLPRVKDWRYLERTRAKTVRYSWNSHWRTALCNRCWALRFSSTRTGMCRVTLQRNRTLKLFTSLTPYVFITVKYFQIWFLAGNNIILHTFDMASHICKANSEAIHICWTLIWVGGISCSIKGTFPPQ